MNRTLAAVLGTFLIWSGVPHPREVGIWSYGYVVAKGSAEVSADTLPHPFVVTSQVFGYCWSRDKAKWLEEEASPQVRQLLQSAYGPGVSLSELRVTVQPTSSRARQDRLQARAGAGRVMDFTLPVVDDKASCLPPRRGLP